MVQAYEQRLIETTRYIDAYWRRAGVPDDRRCTMREMYEATKRVFRSQTVDRIVRDGDSIGRGHRVHHVPGHCPGLVCLQVHDVLLTSDHVLARITPHQFPASLMAFAGLEHYFESLAKIRRVEGIRLALGGHEEPIHDLHRRIDEIRGFHDSRLDRTLGICDEPRSVFEVAGALFGDPEGYGSILAIDEAGAHVEYLHARGRLREERGGPSVARDADVVRYVAC
jgi:glyoxylase-like metal-dependent hydrolase (beta-lactamase superfamily II)